MSLVSTLASVSSPPPLLRVTISHQSATSPMSVSHAASTPTHTANRAAMMSLSPRGEAEGVGMWTEEEHARFLEAVKLFANGPWKRVADYVGTRSVRQTMTHAQKYRLKAARRLRSMRAKSDLLLKHHGSLGPMAMNPRLLPFGDKSDAAGVSTPSKKQQPKRAEGAAKPRRRRQYASLDTVSITDAVSILDSSLLATTPIATAEARNAKMLTPMSSYNSSEDVRPAKLVKEEMTPIPASEPVIKIEEIVDEDMEDLAEVIDAILDSDLETCPSLEDCATELLDLLF